MIRLFRLLRSMIGPIAILIFAAHAPAAAIGDLAVISFASDDPDALAFVVLRDIPAGTAIRFTDSGWLAAGGFRLSEGGIQYTAASTLTPGAVISRTDPFTSGGWAINNNGVGANGLALSTSGDQILAFVGDASSPLFLHAVHFDSTGYVDATSSNTTAAPTGLIVGVTAVDLPEADNGYYNGPTTGTPEELLAAIGNPGNWNTSDSPLAPPAWSFTVLGGSPANPPQAYAGADRSVVLNAALVTVELGDAVGSDPDGLTGAVYDWMPVTTVGLVSWQNREGPMVSTASPAAAQVTFDTIGEYELTLTVTDSTGLAASDTVTISVHDPTPIGQFDPPPGYYSAATGQGGALQVQLSQIITSGHVQQTYGDYKTSASRYDEDTDIPGNILLVYNRASVSADWDSGITWNREHVWPQSRQPGSASDGSTGNLGDPHALRPANPRINSSRSNKPFGVFTATGQYGHEGSFYFPGDADKGDIARSQFYSATRYMSTLSLVSGIPSGDTMGDLDSMLRWHYTDVPDDFERRRNHLIYEDQFNRSPFVDRPEFVWSVFGDGANDSTLYLSPEEPSDGASTVQVNFSPIIVGGPPPAVTPITLAKAGVDPTYYSVTTLGDAICDITGRFNALEFGAQQRTLSVGIAAPDDTPGELSGSVVIDNLDVSSEAPGQGSDDGDDLVTVSLLVFDHSEGSLAPDSDSNALTIDFGSVPAAAGIQTAGYSVYNLASTSGFTADLDLLWVAPVGDDHVLTTDAAPFTGLPGSTGLPGGAGVMFNAGFDPTVSGTGSYLATYTFDVADENLPGATLGAALTLTLTGTVSAAVFPFNDDGDADVDAIDAANFLDCITGPSGGWLTIDCANHDWDADGDVDLADAFALQSLFTGSAP